MPKQWQGHITDYYHSVRNQISDEIADLSSKNLNNTSVDDWVSFFTEKHALQPIKLLTQPPLIMSKPNEEDPSYMRGFRHQYIEENKVIIKLPIEQNPFIRQILEYMASTWEIMAPGMEYDDGGYIVFEVRGTDPNQVSKHLSSVKTNTSYLNSDIIQENNNLPEFIRQKIKERMTVVSAKEQSFQTLAKALGAELQLTPEAEKRFNVSPELKKSISELRRPVPQNVPSIKFDKQSFETILSIIDIQSSNFERTIETANKLGEEDFRNLLLATLNGAFNQKATGETFSKRGKVDITLNIPKGGVFIAETKIWDGPKTIDEAATQILGYLTWRDACGVVIIFSRNKGFSDVQDQFSEAIKCLKSISGDVYEVDRHHWIARHSLPEDLKQTIEIHYFVYNICTLTEV